MGSRKIWLWERIAAITAVAAQASWCIGSLCRTIDQRCASYGGIHIADAINWYNTNHPEESIRSLEPSPALYEKLGGQEGLGLSYERFLESISTVSKEEKGQNIVVAYAPSFIGRPQERIE